MIGQQCCLFPGRPIFNRYMEGVIIGVIETHPSDPHFQDIMFMHRQSYTNYREIKLTNEWKHIVGTSGE